MAGHVSEKTWDIVSDEVSRKLGKLVQFIVEAESQYDDLLQLWQHNGNDDQEVANQLFGGTATAEQLAKTVDLKNALLAAHAIHESDAQINAMRVMT